MYYEEDWHRIYYLKLYFNIKLFKFKSILNQNYMAARNEKEKYGSFVFDIFCIMKNDNGPKKVDFLSDEIC